MKVIVGLTGQSGAGKTTVSKAFEQQGFDIINCDIIAREVTLSGSDCCKQLAKLFPHCFDENLTLDRRKMAETVFSDKQKLDMLNSNIYPFINQSIKERIAASKSSFILLDAPTLFEAGADKLCDTIVSVVADHNTRLARIVERDNIPKELAQKRFASQHTTEFFKERCEYVIENNGRFDETADKTRSVINNIKERYDKNGG